MAVASENRIAFPILTSKNMMAHTAMTSITNSIKNSSYGARLVAIDTHPIQYHAPVYRAVQTKFGIPMSVIHGSDCSVAGYWDREFGTSFAWDVDLLSGYDSVFLSRVPRDSEKSNQRPSLFGLGKALRRLNPRAVLLTGYSPTFHQVAFLQARRFGAPILFRGETTDNASHRWSVQSFVRSSALRLFYKNCSKMLYVGHNSYQHFKRLGIPATKLLFSPYCVDTSVFLTSERDRGELRDQTRGRLGIGNLETVLLFSGKFSARKGPDLLLSGVKSLPSEIRARSVVLFLGSGAMERELRSLAKRAPEIEVRFAGFQNQKQLSPYYHAADMLVLPSRYSETWGLVVNEALHHGVPCVVSDSVGCGPDLISPGETGEVFETDSVESLVAAILRGLILIGRPTVREWCRNKGANYTTEKAAEGIADAYWSVVGNGKEVGDHCPART
jgi:glycosyltransferase involved in cell wall biosynthesis